MAQDKPSQSESQSEREKIPPALAIRIAKKIPFIREFTTIANAYAFTGSHFAFSRIAPVKQIYSRILKKGIFVFLVTKIFMHFAHAYGVDIKTLDFPSLNLNIFPNLLGFGIGIFALLFSIKSDFIVKLQDKNQSNGFDAQILNVDLAYPLIVIAWAVVVSACLKFFPSNNFTQTTAIASFFYGMAMIFELIGFIFITAFRMISDVSKQKPET